MCGILGVVGERIADRVAKQIFQTALDSIAHRGPDAQGLARGNGFCLGHRRLAIIDLTEGGAQPMTDPDTGIVLVFNGEIYNYIELRQQLAGQGVTFHTESDTEVLLKAFIAWGSDCVKRFNGMFAFGLIDPRTEQLFLARDRFGVKPLYMMRDGNTLAFASEVKAIQGLRLAPREIDRQALREFLVAGRYATDGRSFYQQVGMLRPGYWASYKWKSGEYHTQPFWQYPQIDLASPRTRQDAYRQFAELMDSALMLRLRSDVPLAVSLSGGLDSSAILAGAAAISQTPPRSFTSTYDLPDTGELDWASIAAAGANSQLVECKTTMGDWLAILRKCIGHLDGPVATPAVVPVYGLMQQVRAAGIKVLLEGQGADELLGGYVQYSIAQFADALVNPTRWPEAAGIGRRGLRQFGVKNFFYHYTKEHLPWAIRGIRRVSGYNRLFRPQTVRDAHDEIYFLRADHGESRRGVDRRLWLDHCDVQLPRLLHYGDALTMAHGIESRMPFMDYRLVDWVFRLPIDLRFDPLHTKWMIRQYLVDHGQPVIAQRRDKKGYPTPYTHWMSQMDSTLLDRLFPKDAAVFEFVDPVALRQAFGRQKGGRQFGANLLFRILSTQIWLEGER